MKFMGKTKGKYRSVEKHLDELDTIVSHSSDEFTRLEALHEIESIKKDMNKRTYTAAAISGVMAVLLLISFLLMGR